MTTNIEFKKGILFVSLNGCFYSDTSRILECRLIPIILGMSLRKVNIDISDIKFIDKSGIDTLIKLSNVVSRYDGKVVVSGINDKIKLTLRNSDLFDYCFKSRDLEHSTRVLGI